MASWYAWTHEPIWMDEGSSLILRKDAIALLCRKGLLPLIHSHGYALELSEDELIRVLLRCLFAVFQGKRVYPKNTHKDAPHRQEHYFHFMFKLDTILWLAFWETWGTLQDFQESSYGYNVRFQLPELIWSWVDLNQSPAAIDLEEQLQDEDAFAEASKGREDPYLQETARRDFQDRHWF